MTFDKSRYPLEWKSISLARREKAGWRCEWCKAPHGESVVRVPGGFYAVVEIDEVECEQEVIWRDNRGQRLDVWDVATKLGVPLDHCWGPDCVTMPDCRVWQSKVVLTCAHTDLDGGDKHDKHNIKGLRALCNSCHLSYDLEDHIRHAKETRLKRKAIGPLPGLDFV